MSKLAETSGRDQRPKAEIRRPKEIRNPKSEGRNTGSLIDPGFGLRTFFGLRPSTFGLQFVCIVFLALATCFVGCGKQAGYKPQPLPDDLPKRFDAQRAWRDLERVVSFGPRPSGSEALAHTATYIVEQLRATTMEVEEQTFRTNTPRGPITFKNIIARTRPGCPPRLIIGGHYDTKWFPDFRFVGANDGGSSTAALLELARALDKQPVDAWLVWFDGEECIKTYEDGDGLFGSMYFARTLHGQKRLREVQAMILLDMVGDRNFRLTLPKPYPLEQHLTKKTFEAAYAVGLRNFVSLLPTAIYDDHIPFLLNRVEAVNLIDYDYGNLPGQNNFWHTERDTLERCAPESLGIAGQIALELIRRVAMEKWPRD
ncbi:MAG: M28 family peptidase [Verrucomicrobia bacterium]|nr:M28 family peptidase [Verrucomicrobiota bacterium]